MHALNSGSFMAFSASGTMMELRRGVKQIKRSTRGGSSAKASFGGGGGVGCGIYYTGGGVL